jgi:hypothetical protein
VLKELLRYFLWKHVYLSLCLFHWVIHIIIVLTYNGNLTLLSFSQMKSNFPKTIYWTVHLFSTLKLYISWAWQHTSIIPAMRRLRQGYREFEASLGYVVRICLSLHIRFCYVQGYGSLLQKSVQLIFVYLSVNTIVTWKCGLMF